MVFWERYVLNSKKFSVWSLQFSVSVFHFSTVSKCPLSHQLPGYRPTTHTCTHAYSQIPGLLAVQGPHELEIKFHKFFSTTKMHSRNDIFAGHRDFLNMEGLIWLWELLWWNGALHKWLYMGTLMPYSGKFWWEKTLVNNKLNCIWERNFGKFKPSS